MLFFSKKNVLNVGFKDFWYTNTYKWLRFGMANLINMRASMAKQIPPNQTNV